MDTKFLLKTVLFCAGTILLTQSIEALAEKGVVCPTLAEVTGTCTVTNGSCQFTFKGSPTAYPQDWRAGPGPTNTCKTDIDCSLTGLANNWGSVSADADFQGGCGQYLPRTGPGVYFYSQSNPRYRTKLVETTSACNGATPAGGFPAYCVTTDNP